MQEILTRTEMFVGSNKSFNSITGIFESFLNSTSDSATLNYAAILNKSDCKQF